MKSSKKSTPDTILITTHQASLLLDIDPGTLTRWKRLGLDEAMLGKNQWDAKKLLDWWLDNIYQAGSEETPTLQAERVRYERARADKMEIQVSQLRGDLLPRSDVAEGWAWRLHEVFNGLNAYRDRLPPILEGKNKIEMRKIIDNENWNLKDNFYREGKFCPKQEVKKQPSKRGSKKKKK